MALSQIDLEAAISERDFAALRKALEHLPPFDTANLIRQMPDENRVVAFRVLPRELAADVSEYLPLDVQQELLKSLGQEEAAAILDEMAPDDRTMLFDELPGTVTKQLMNLLDPEELRIAVQLLGYPENSAGRLMTPEYVRLRPDWTVARALEHIRLYGSDSETLDFVYVINEQGKLIDDIHIRKLLLAEPDTRIADSMDDSFTGLKATDHQETAIEAMRRSDLTALPVTDSEGILIGIVTVDDVLDVVEAEATEDVQKFGGMEALGEPYLETGFARIIRKRAVWLIVLFLGQMLTATAMGFFEEEIEQAVVLALFVPLIISLGGNSGSQAATLVIRAMALGEVALRDWWRLMRREILVGLALGAILGAIGFLQIAVWSTYSNVYGEYWFSIGLTVCIALIGIVLWGTVAGSMMPFVLRRLNLDPATSSAPFIATLVDVTGLVIYFSVAIVILRGTVL